MSPAMLNVILEAMQGVKIAYQLAKQVQRGALTEAEALADWQRIRDENRAAEGRWHSAGKEPTDEA